jgi:glutamate-1-semialdehyde 2,1-aminomutase
MTLCRSSAIGSPGSDRRRNNGAVQRLAAASEVRERYERTTSRSHALWDRAVDSLPGGNTRTTIFHDPYPVYLARGAGCRVVDVDGVERIDFINNYTSLVLGHCHPRVVEAVREQAGMLMSAAAPNELEVELAETIRERLPSIEQLRFANSGTEATMLALRAARAFTGRGAIAAFAGAYHGSHDYAASVPASPTAPPGGPGVPRAVAETVVVCPFNDGERTRDVLAAHLDDLAAVIVEPVLGAGGVVPATTEFLSSLRELTSEAGALLVFDEVISYRVGRGGAQGRYGIEPDLTTLGKVIGGGLPVGAFGGRGDVMALFDPRSRDGIGHGGTFNANPLTMAAGLATLSELTPACYEELEALTEGLVRRLAELPPLSVRHVGSLFRIAVGDDRLQQELNVALLNRGILLTPRGMGCLSTPMTTVELDAFVDATRAGLADLGLL